MPNDVTNILEFDCGIEQSTEIMEFLREKGKGYGTIDFNKLIPMPESLDITEGSETDRGIEIYLTAVNPKTKDYGIPKMSESDFSVLFRLLSNERHFGLYNAKLNDDEIEEYTKSSSFAYCYKIGEVAANNMKQYGATTWYKWCIKHWGSKWNAYDCVDVDPGDGCMIFYTAWDSVPNVIRKISEKFPNVTMHYSWADEDLGSNTGRLTFKYGQEIDRDIPPDQSLHAYEIACDAWGYDIDDLGLKPSVDPHQAKHKEHEAR